MNVNIKKQTRFLIVEDFEPMRRALRNMLNAIGYENIASLSDGEEAIQFLKSNSVDCILSDWNMPTLSGLQLLQHIRTSGQMKNIPFILVTSEASWENVNLAITEGVTEFLTKPFTQRTLQEKVDWALAHPGQRVLDRRLDNEVGHHLPMSEDKNRAPNRTTVLVVDDVSTNIDVISGILKENYHIKAATSGKKALKIARREPAPDLILLDIMMPEMDGIEVCRQLKEDSETEDIPVIFLTAKAEATDISAGLELGAIDYITKPANPVVLKARVSTHLKLKKYRDELKGQIDMLVENARLREDVERMTRHDLKNPLSAIINTTTSLLEDAWMGMEQKQEIDTIRNASHEMLNLINRSMDLYKMEVGAYQLNAGPVDIVSITQSVVKECRVNAHEYGVSIFFDAPDSCACHGEALLCFSLLSNLVRNGVEASAKKGEVKVVIECRDPISITIHNDGSIPEEIREQFFEKYVTAGKQDGSGLGTYSAKLMAKTQKGDIVFESSKEDGTTLSVTLPKGCFGSQK